MTPERWAELVAHRQAHPWPRHTQAMFEVARAVHERTGGVPDPRIVAIMARYHDELADAAERAGAAVDALGPDA